MKKLLLLLIITTFATLNVAAQMSDNDVIEYVQQQQKAGKSQQAIAIDLQKKGVTKAQVMRLKGKYDQMQSDNGSTSGNTVGNRTRVNNGEVFQDINIEDESHGPSKIFGHDIFRNKNLSFEPNMNIATPTNYTLGPGDEVILDIYGASQLNAKYKISPDGTITVEGVGPIAISGMTVTQAQNKVKSKVGVHYQDSQIKLTVGQTRTILVNVMGEVATPGTYTLSAFATVFNALYLAGGITDLGTMREIKVSRGGRIITSVDIYDYIINGKLTGNIMLKDNDVIIVGPYENLVTIEGCVKRPMCYEMKKNESLQSLLKYTGGFTGNAYKQKVRVERVSDEGLTVHNIDEWDFSSFHNEDGDNVVVSSVIDRYRNTVVIKGAVFRPGKYQIGNSVNSVKTLVEQAGGLLEQAYVSRAVIQRMNSDRTLTSITLDLNGIMNGSVADVPLMNEDELYISSKKELMDARNMTIAGEVMHPGNYKYSENTTIEDLITLAGGLTESASLQNIEVARRITTVEDGNNGEHMAKVFSVSLTDGQNIAGESNFKLEPYDVVTIHRNPNYQTQKHIHISGEVLYAGNYVLKNKGERLSEIISRAGGLTSKAAVDNAQLIRKYSAKDMELKRQMLEMATSKADSIDAINQLQKVSYSIGIDLAKAIANPGSVDDVILAEGDSIYVPQQNNIVKISGDVLYPNSVTYAKGKSYKYYINQAGGVSKTGNKSQAYIVYANGQVSKASKGKIVPGCEIIIPQKPKKEMNPQTASLFIGGASALASITAVVAAVIRK